MSVQLSYRTILDIHPKDGGHCVASVKDKQTRKLRECWNTISKTDIVKANSMLDQMDLKVEAPPSLDDLKELAALMLCKRQHNSRTAPHLNRIETVVNSKWEPSIKKALEAAKKRREREEKMRRLIELAKMRSGTEDVLLSLENEGQQAIPGRKVKIAEAPSDVHAIRAFGVFRDDPFTSMTTQKHESRRNRNQDPDDIKKINRNSASQQSGVLKSSTKISVNAIIPPTPDTIPLAQYTISSSDSEDEIFTTPTRKEGSERRYFIPPRTRKSHNTTLNGSSSSFTFGRSSDNVSPAFNFGFPCSVSTKGDPRLTPPSPGIFESVLSNQQPSALPLPHITLPDYNTRRPKEPVSQSEIIPEEIQSPSDCFSSGPLASAHEKHDIVVIDRKASSSKATDRSSIVVTVDEVEEVKEGRSRNLPTEILTILPKLSPAVYTERCPCASQPNVEDAHVSSSTLKESDLKYDEVTSDVTDDDNDDDDNDDDDNDDDDNDDDDNDDDDDDDDEDGDEEVEEVNEDEYEEEDKKADEHNGSMVSNIKNETSCIDEAAHHNAMINTATLDESKEVLEAQEAIHNMSGASSHTLVTEEVPKLVSVSPVAIPIPDHTESTAQEHIPAAEESALSSSITFNVNNLEDPTIDNTLIDDISTDNTPPSDPDLPLAPQRNHSIKHEDFGYITITSSTISYKTEYTPQKDPPSSVSHISFRTAAAGTTSIPRKPLPRPPTSPSLLQEVPISTPLAKKDPVQQQQQQQQQQLCEHCGGTGTGGGEPAYDRTMDCKIEPEWEEIEEKGAHSACKEGTARKKWWELTEKLGKKIVRRVRIRG